MDEREPLAAICDLCGWCQDDCQVFELSRSHQRVALCSHCREDLSRMFSGRQATNAVTGQHL
jgi:hypothetical protein